jgi:hypothetical protein
MKIEFTKAELAALRLIVGNTLEYADQAESLFPDKRSRAAAYRVLVKIGGPDRSGDMDAGASDD